MIVDAGSVPEGTAIETEVCIVGAGAAGITLAREFADAKFRVTLLESGGMEFEQATEQLYEGESVGQPFQDLTTCRLRFFGGSTNHWGGWCLPFDEIDFEARDGMPNHGWPFPRTHLDPFYARAQKVCGLGPYDYKPASWGIPAKIVPPPFEGPDFGVRVLQVSTVHFGPAYAAELRAAPRVTAYLHANAFHLDGGENDAEVKALTVKTLAGKQFRVHARIYIVATGGIENARLLLASGKEGGNGLGNANDLVGRYFMVHLNYSGGIIAPADPHMNFDFRRGGNVYAPTGARHPFVSYVGPTPDGMRRRHLPNMKFHWSYDFDPVVDGVKALERLAHGESGGGSWSDDLSAVIGHLEGIAKFAARKALFGEGIPIRALNVICSSEQQPNPDSRVMLGAKRDALGMREIVVDWRVLPDDKDKAVETVRLFGAEIGRAGFGRLNSTLAATAAWPEDFYGDEHHMGTTRMHTDPKRGVVDPDCRIHGMSNLYMAGSSVFPSSSPNNSTLTIVALALRLADHVKRELA